jgi:hypothetical protein
MQNSTDSVMLVRTDPGERTSIEQNLTNSTNPVADSDSIKGEDVVYGHGTATRGNAGQRITMKTRRRMIRGGDKVQLKKIVGREP